MVILDVGRCPLCGKPSYLELPEDLATRIMTWYNTGCPGFVQNAFPELTPGQREMLITSSHEACFDEAFPEEE